MISVSRTVGEPLNPARCGGPYRARFAPGECKFPTTTRVSGFWPRCAYADSVNGVLGVLRLYPPSGRSNSVSRENATRDQVAPEAETNILW
jgi:hypothetical protein